MMELDYSERKQERDDTTTFSVQARRFLEILEEGIKKNSDGRWVMPLPFKDKTPSTYLIIALAVSVDSCL